MVKSKAHLLFIPLPFIGHFQPFVQLLYTLNAHCPGTKVTVVGSLSVPSELESELLALQTRGDFKNINLHIHDVPSWRLPQYEEDPQFPVRGGPLSDSFHVKIQGFREKLLTEKNTPDVVTAIVSDMLFEWCKDLADELSVPWYPYFSVSAVTTLIVIEAAKFHKAYENSQKMPDDAESLRKAIPSLVDFAGSNHILHGDFIKELYDYPDYYIRIRNQTIQASGILLNTTKELEEQFGALAALEGVIASTSKVFTIGPSLQLPGFGCQYSSASSNTDCLSWLDKQQENSVLFVSFGSIVMMQKAQVLEVAAGLESSGTPFLWALKTGSGQILDVLPVGFLERTRGWGRIETGWVPQGKVLEHPATGGFLTHCGWNSIMESICTGVPCIGWPIAADQPANARFLQEAKIGFTVASFKLENKHLWADCTRREIEMAIRSLMLRENGQSARKNMAVMQKLVRAAVARGGSSCQCLHQFLNEIA